VSLRTRVDAMRAARWLRACTSVGADPRLNGRPDIYAVPGIIRIGDRFRLASRPVPSHIEVGPGGVLEIGDDVRVAHGGAIAAFERVRIGDGTCIGPYVLIMDTNFHGNTGDQSVQHDCRPVVIGARCRIGSRVIITRGARIGDGAEILAGSVVSGDVPAGSCVGGARIAVFGRAGEPASRWDGAVALLPRLAMEALSLDAPPDPDGRPADLQWTVGGAQAMMSAIRAQFGVALEPSLVTGGRRWRDIAETIECARHTA
jgi:acetyltransferase-like isoleucine patch superfamily enzyme